MFKNSQEYADYYKSIIRNKDTMKYSQQRLKFKPGVVCNDYEAFIQKTIYITLGRC